MQTYYDQTKVNEVLSEGYDFQPVLLTVKKPVVKTKQAKLAYRNALKAAQRAFKLTGHNDAAAHAVIKRVYRPKYRLNCQVSAL